MTEAETWERRALAAKERVRELEAIVEKLTGVPCQDEIAADGAEILKALDDSEPMTIGGAPVDFVATTAGPVTWLRIHSNGRSWDTPPTARRFIDIRGWRTDGSPIVFVSDTAPESVEVVERTDEFPGVAP